MLGIGCGVVWCVVLCIGFHGVGTRVKIYKNECCGVYEWVREEGGGGGGYSGRVEYLLYCRL